MTQLHRARIERGNSRSGKQPRGQPPRQNKQPKSHVAALATALDSSTLWTWSSIGRIRMISGTLEMQLPSTSTASASAYAAPIDSSGRCSAPQPNIEFHRHLGTPVVTMPSIWMNCPAKMRRRG
jgi:hypothetical protein